MINRNKLIAQIHIAKTQLKMDEETYRTFLTNTVKKGSCSDMTISELHIVVSALLKRGFNQSGKRRIGSSNEKVRSNIIKKIRAKWLEMHTEGIVRNSSEDALNVYVSKIARNKQGYPIHFVTWLDNEQATRVLERLKKWQSRERKVKLGVRL